MTTTNSSAASNRDFSLLRDSRGLSTVEYVIILVLIAAAAVGAWSLLGQSVRGKAKSAIGEMRGMSIEGR
jgi:Flp pilus assembly pilin Flp